MKKPMRKVKKFETGGSANDYKGTDEIVQYRMGQIKDPGIDLFKLTSGEAQEAKPTAKTRSIVPEAAPTPAKAAPAAPTESKSKGDYDSGGNFKGANNDKVTKEETGKPSLFKLNEYGDKYTLEDTPKPAKPVAKKAPSSSSSSSSTTASNAKPAAKTDTKNPYDSNAANAAIKAQAKLDSEYTPPKPPPSPGRLGFRGNFFSGKPYGADKFEKEQRAKKSMAAEGNYKKGGSVKMASGGKVSSASKRADGCAVRGKTRA